MSTPSPTDLNRTSEKPTLWPQDYGVVALVALLGALFLSITGSIVGTQGGTNRVFWFEVGFDIVPAWLSLLLVGAAPLVAVMVGRFRNHSSTTNRPLQTDWRILLALVVLGTLFYASLMQWVAHRIAYAPDESAAVLQAQTFALGHVTPRIAPELAPLVLPKWTQTGIFAVSPTTGYYWTTYWPGYALLMAPFAFFGLEWLTNPFLSALSLALVWVLTRRLTRSDEAGWWAVAIMLVSTQVAAHAATYFSMPAHLLFNALFCLLLVRGTKRDSFFAGLVGGFALVLHNPAPHFSFALPWLLWMCRYRRTHLIPLFTGYTLIFVPLFFGWALHMRDMNALVPHVATTTAPSSVTEKIQQILRPPTPLLLMARIAGLGKLILWAMPGAAGLALLGWLAANRERRQTRSPQSDDDFNAHYLWLLGASLISSFVIYMAVSFDQGHGWGFRYLHQNWLALPILGGAFLARQTALWKQTARVLIVFGLAFIFPLHAIQIRSSLAFAEDRRPPVPPSLPAITFIQETGQASIWIKNDPFLRNPQWNLRFLSPPQNATIANRYLRGAHRVQSGKWGETWIGTAFARSASTAP